MPPATREQLGGKCSLGAPITIGKSTASDASGPEVAIAASSEGVVASWQSSDEQVTTIALDASGRPRGEGRTLAASKALQALQLWELGDGKFVLVFARPEQQRQRPSEPTHAFQRVDATGELVGSPVPFLLDQIRAVAPFRNNLLMLSSNGSRRDILRVAAAERGIEVKRSALPKYPGDVSIQQSLVPTSSGPVWVVSDEIDQVKIIEREEGKSAKVKVPSGFWHEPAQSEDDEPLWLSCHTSPMVRGLKFHEDKLVEVELPKSVCDGPAWWDVGPAPNVHEVNNRGLGVLFPPESGSLLFTQKSLQLGRHPTLRNRHARFFDSTWTGTSVLTIYLTGKRNAWTVVAQPVTCEGSAPSPAPSASASSPATGANGTKK